VILGDVFEDVGWGLGFFEAGEVGAGDLQAVEEDRGALGVEVSGGDAAEDVVEGDLDGGAVVDGLHAEDADAAGEGGVGQALAVVVVAEVLGAEGGRAAAASVGVDVAAEIAALWVEILSGVHSVGIPLGTLVLKSSEDVSYGLRVSGGARARGLSRIRGVFGFSGLKAAAPPGVALSRAT